MAEQLSLDFYGNTSPETGNHSLVLREETTGLSLDLLQRQEARREQRAKIKENKQREQRRKEIHERIQSIDAGDRAYRTNRVNNFIADTNARNAREIALRAMEDDAREAFGKIGGAMDTAMSSRDAAIKDAFKEDLKWIKSRDGLGTASALRQMNAEFGLGANLDNLNSGGIRSKISDRIYRATGGRFGSHSSSMTNKEAMGMLESLYGEKMSGYLDSVRDKTYGEMEKGTEMIRSDIEGRRKYLSRITTEEQYRARKAVATAATEKSTGGALLGGKGKALGALVGVFALGGVIGNMLSGGHRSNAELYNPNGYQQYYS